MNEPGGNGRSSPVPARSPARRPRAPTITIDTSAVNHSPVRDDGVPLRACTDQTRSLHGDYGEASSARQLSMDDGSPAELRPAHSFESKESRPTSPHNVSSPTPKWGDIQPQNFLSVPNGRSRGNSIDSDEASHASMSDTYIPSSTSSHPGDSGRRLDATYSNIDIINDSDALKADPGTETDFEVEDNRFAFSPGQLGKLLNPKSLSAFYALGGLSGLEKGLRTDRVAGLSVDEKHLDGSVSFETAKNAAQITARKAKGIKRVDSLALGRVVSSCNTNESFSDRLRIFKDNRLPEKKTKSIFQLAWLAYNDKVLILLTVAAVISLALGIYQAITATDGEARVQWVEGVAIVVAIVVVVVVGAANDYQKERQFVKLNKKKEDRVIKVIRSGHSREISIYEVLVGDVMHLEPGDMIPVDGIFISGHNVKCDESSATGESDLLRKTSGEDVFSAIEANENVAKMDPFIISGGKVAEGIGTFIVTAVGIHSSHGKTLMSLREEAQTTPLQSKLNILAEYIAKLGLAAGLLLFVVTFIKFLTQLNSISGGAGAKGQRFLNVFIVAVTIVVVAVPEGLPLAVTLALAFATTRMLKDNNLVRVLRACETMGNATTICSDKTGTLTQNKMTVVAGTLSTAFRFGDKAKADSPNASSPDTKGSLAASDNGSIDLSVAEFIATISSDVLLLLKQSIVINSTAFEAEENGEVTFVGSKTETALLSFAREHLAMYSVNEERSNAEISQVVPFDSARKCMATVVKLEGGMYRMYVKGASEIMLSKCNRIIRDPSKETSEISLTPDHVETLTRIITDYASRSLRTIGLLYKDFTQWPPKGSPVQKDDPKQAVFDKIFKDMVFLGIVGIQDPLQEGVPDAVRACQSAGVFVRMVTGDNLLTAKAIAEECGIYTPGGLAIEGPRFRSMSKIQMDQTIPKLQVLARSSPSDKKLLVKRLKEMGETVAVTGDGTNDAPALKAADVGFSMGIAGTEVAKEASAIILMDDNFASIVKAIMWGRAVNDSVQKFLQFQITVNITAVVLTFISAVASGDDASVLTAVQLLWVNLIMDTFAALALATDPPTPSILNRKPAPKSAPLITLKMWKMIIGQSIYQLVVTLILYFGGVTIFSYTTPGEHKQLQTLIFNTFVWMQIFNQYNNRRLDDRFNIFEGVQNNYFFIGIQVIIIGGQILIIYIGGAAFGVVRMRPPLWAYSVILGALSLPMAAFIRLIPDELIRKLVPAWFERKATPQVFVSDEERHFEWNPALEEIREELSLLKKLRGGRLNGIKHKLQHSREIISRSRSGSHSRLSSIPQTPTGEQQGSEFGGRSPSFSQVPPSPDSRRSTTTRRRGRSRSNSAFGPAAAMAGVIAGSIAGWSPIPRDRDEGSSSFQEFQGRTELETQGGIEIHPETNPQDPVIVNSKQKVEEPPSQVPDTSPAFGQSLAPPKA